MVRRASTKGSQIQIQNSAHSRFGAVTARALTAIVRRLIAVSTNPLTASCDRETSPGDERPAPFRMPALLALKSLHPSARRAITPPPSRSEPELALKWSAARLAATAE